MANYIFCGGGTGGHLYPGLAVAEELGRQQPDAQVVFACSDRSVDETILGPTPFSYLAQPTRPFRKNPLMWPGFLLAWNKSIRQARAMLDEVQPKAVLGLGGFAGAAVAIQAAKRGIPTALLNPDGVPGKANLYLAEKVDRIFTQFEQTRNCFSASLRSKVRTVGCPIRAGILDADRLEALEYYQLRPDRKTILVFGGSALAVSIVETMAQFREELGIRSEHWQILIAVRGDRNMEVQRMFNGCGIHAKVVPYFDRMDLAYAAGDLAVVRGGACTIAELAALGIPAVIFPYPHHADRQQFINAAPLVEAGQAIVIEDTSSGVLNAKAMRAEVSEILDQPEWLAAMTKHPSRQEALAAAHDVAQWLRTGGEE
ncbi:MAG: hypothetical protein HN909_08960 [Phycisphaerales bacterium]|jgi:UDP-N-acetylglucosamine--N-acetylmuramyl-(pentapeptide) pyrophosphoryl-undecaprenol N-acetylglucosamine transferase|nr:hypothetical protein [Phycisphaerales bacterium]MBT7171880.1 hypothetical protein [Phycisphaerales bacterium]